MYFRKNPQIANDAYRDSIDTICSISESDLTETVEIERRFLTPLYWLRGYAILASTTVNGAVASIAPGASPGQGSQENLKNQQLVVDQTELNVRTGHAYALEKSAIPSVRTGVLHAGMAADPARLEWVTFTYADTNDKRRVGFTTERMLLVEVEVDFDFENSSMTENWVMQPENWGQAGTTVIIPVDKMDDINYTPLPEFVPVSYQLYEPTVPTTIADLPQISFPDAPAMFAMSTNGHLGRTLNHSDPTPNWEKIVDASSFAGLPIRFILDPWAPSYRAYVVTLDEISSTYGVGVYEIINLMGTPTVNLLDTQSIYALSAHIKASINIRGFISISTSRSWGIFGDGPISYFWRRDSYESSFTTPIVYSSPGSTGETHTSISAWHDLEDYATDVSNMEIWLNGGYKFFGAHCNIYRSTNGGTAITNQGELTTYSYLVQIISPYDSNTDGHKVYAFGGDGNGPNCHYYWDGATWTNISVYFADISMWAVGTTTIYGNIANVYTQDINNLAFVFNGGARLARSLDGAATWYHRIMPDANMYYIGGWPYDGDTFITWSINTPKIFWTTDDAVTWNECTGDFYTVVDPAGGAGIFQVVPLWIPL